MNAIYRTAAIAALLLTTTACYEQLTGGIDESDDRAVVTNDETELADRMTYLDEDVPIDPPATGAFASMASMTDGPALAPSAVDLRLIAQVRPPLINEQRVQATSISRRSAIAFLVSYNVQGETFLGGADYLINWFSRFPIIHSSASFADSDVSAVAHSGSAVYLAQATNAPGFSTSASIETLSISNFRMSLLDNNRFDLSSFAATSVLSVGNTVYVTTGSDGHLYALDHRTLEVKAEYPLEDARWVEHDADNDRIVVVQGTPGRISTFEEGEFTGGTMNLLNTFPFPGANQAEAKSTVEVVGGKAFIAAGPDGVQVMCLDDGSIVGSVPRPDPASLGLDPSVVTTNAVTVDDDLMFISNGEAGVYVAAGAEDFDRTSCDEPQSISVLGSLRFGDLESANHVSYRSGFLFVAAGLGGVKIVLATVTP